MRRLVALGVVLLCTAASAGAAPTQVIERVRLATAGTTQTQSVPAGVFLVLTSPPDYARERSESTQGRWIGPEYVASGRAELRGRATIEWRLRFENEPKKTDVAARDALTQGWKEELRGGVSVPHVVGKRVVGTLDGDFVSTEGPVAGDAVHELAMAFPIAPRLLALVNFVLRNPAREDASPWGEYVVNGVPAALWNRGQALRAMSGVRIDGNLPPTRIAIAATPDGRRIRGTVADAFRHPTVGGRVALQRLSGSAWETLTTSKTSAKGVYSIRVGARGQYRVVATVGTASATSSVVRAGR